MRPLLFLFSIGWLLGCKSYPPLPTVASVDLEQYAGTWYEIASFPSRFQRGCHCTTATYTLHPKGYVVVENRCNRDSTTGKESYIKGKAFVVKGSGNARLKVQFFWPFRGDYYIIHLASDYRYTLVGSPSRNYLWLLSRTPQLPASDIDTLLQAAKDVGFDTSRLVFTVQEGC